MIMLIKYDKLIKENKTDNMLEVLEVKITV